MKNYSNIIDNKKLILFGAGSYCEEAIVALKNIAYFVDNDKNKWGYNKYGKVINNVMELEKENKEAIFIIITSSYAEEISVQLIKIGFVHETHFVSWSELKTVLYPSDFKKKFIPYKVILNNFIENGVEFEIGSKVEHQRVTNLADEEEFVGLMLKELRPDDVFFDIGSSVGLITLHAAFLAKLVVSFEPDPAYNKVVEKNISLNPSIINKVKLVGWAVSDHQGYLELFTEGVNSVYSPSITNSGKRDSITIKTNSIDNALEEKEIPLPDVIKIDIEGAELFALKGMRRLLGSTKAPRCIFIELHPKFLANLNLSAVDCIELLNSYGYRQTHINFRKDQIHCIFIKDIN